MNAQQKDAHIQLIDTLDGQRIPTLDDAEVTPGWVVTKHVPPGFWLLCNVEAFPLKPTEHSPASEECQKWLREYGYHIGDGIMVVLIPDEESKSLYSGGPILIADLLKDPFELLDLSLRELEDNQELSEMRRRAAMIVAGWEDTK